MDKHRVSRILSEWPPYWFGWFHALNRVSYKHWIWTGPSWYDSVHLVQSSPSSLCGFRFPRFILFTFPKQTQHHHCNFMLLTPCFYDSIPLGGSFNLFSSFRVFHSTHFLYQYFFLIEHFCEYTFKPQQVVSVTNPDRSRKVIWTTRTWITWNISGAGWKKRNN